MGRPMSGLALPVLKLATLKHLETTMFSTHKAAQPPGKTGEHDTIGGQLSEADLKELSGLYRGLKDLDLRVSAISRGLIHIIQEYPQVAPAIKEQQTHHSQAGSSNGTRGVNAKTISKTTKTSRPPHADSFNPGSSFLLGAVMAWTLRSLLQEYKGGWRSTSRAKSNKTLTPSKGRASSLIPGASASMGEPPTDLVGRMSGELKDLLYGEALNILSASIMSACKQLFNDGTLLRSVTKRVMKDLVRTVNQAAAVAQSFPSITPSVASPEETYNNLVNMFAQGALSNQ
ncbi:hypothetical protein TREMEDRAFT_59500 [Tremella mesenterica DSM 1558]|uniref:uncharacterized protein n=1 Tax=Tremella mesenterica (strain ATCC 24925 / CBS 8224 / DSM 1558 / NBRC 9311 / NRRL Y-6157 / RJB 2259-6 / UBC 559-6) TaxID=578456 RepID=UPI0003F4972C|nr:uncharacterized protein TREMEDRAFT_59500 [Tremella mesenterica DSM 1558]EIW73333.1 hypothetical protein TREMEDRAFT_59500 [Tremella mesenterica DSM 1558]